MLGQIGLSLVVSQNTNRTFGLPRTRSSARAGYGFSNRPAAAHPAHAQAQPERNLRRVIEFEWGEHVMP
jgi:hypothetical protein